MRQSETYLVHEFAEMAGVTVRTLHYYDQAGLLKPSSHTHKRARLYRQDDLLRLQQILTLKYLGFSLEEIRDLLDSPVYDVKKSLRMQKQALDDRISQLLRASVALEKTLAAAEAQEALNWDEVCEIIRSVNGTYWRRFSLSDYFTPEQQKQFAEHARSFHPEAIVAAERTWAEITEIFERLRDEPLDHPELQRVAGKMVELIESFTGGDVSIRDSLARMYTDLDALPDDERPYNVAVHRKMREAMRIYQERRGSSS
jgi:DNA-binding transcriptional MerR regulator